MTEMRSIKDIVSDLSKPVNPQRLKQRTQGGRTLDDLPWYQAVRYLDNYALEAKHRDGPRAEMKRALR